MTTKAGEAHHDEAWRAALAREDDAGPTHSSEREGCPGCKWIEDQEQEVRDDIRALEAEWWRYEETATQLGSGQTKEQQTGAHMVWGWLGLRLAAMGNDQESAAISRHESATEDGPMTAGEARHLREYPNGHYGLYCAVPACSGYRPPATEDGERPGLREAIEDVRRAGNMLVGVLGAAPADCDRQDDLCVMHNAEWSTRKGVDLAHCEWIEARMSVVPEWHAAIAALASTPDAPEGLEELRRLSDAATPGPWGAPMDFAPEDRTVVRGTDIHAVRDDGPHWPGFFLGAVESKADAAFIAAAVNYVRARLARDRAGGPE
jgi:hypothetical protein